MNRSCQVAGKMQVAHRIHLRLKEGLLNESTHNKNRKKMLLRSRWLHPGPNYFLGFLWKMCQHLIILPACCSDQQIPRVLVLFAYYLVSFSGTDDVTALWRTQNLDRSGSAPPLPNFSNPIYSSYIIYISYPDLPWVNIIMYWKANMLA